MKNIIIVSLIVLLFSCKEDRLEIFDQQVSGSSIYFPEVYNTALDRKKDFIFEQSFGYMPDTVSVFIKKINVLATGPIMDVDRVFRISSSPESTLISGTHYNIDTDKLIIPAGKNTGSVNITLKRTADMKQQQLSTTLMLEENENFNTNIKYRFAPNQNFKVSLLKYTIKIDDILNAPYAWAVAPYKPMLEDYLGTYSKTKLQLLLDLFDIEPKYFIDEKYAKENYFTIALLSYWGGYMKFWLAKEASEGRIHKDESGQVITMGRYAR
ncbi:DUF4843 domain-containing protein [Sphingobacterium spiritivorum]|uniref:DUF4843 domain-containing protein n=1 Tax=Sphingobacterium spiritivorum TaxID=258 RepID=UPI003DA28EB7